jgi:CMP-N-acetylneuraminic acid synthetase
MMKSVALIPARGGSKSIEGKNLRKIAGYSLLEISIKQAKSVETIRDVYVSSDSEDILQVAISLNCISVKRTAEASSDTASANSVVSEFLNHPGVNLNYEDTIVYLQPTSPFREDHLIEKSLRLHYERKVPIVAVAEVSQHPHKMLTVNASGSLDEYQQGANPTANRQSLPEVLIATGSLYIFSVGDFLENGQIPVMGALPYIVSGVNSFDIDSEMDLKIAQEIGKNYEF